MNTTTLNVVSLGVVSLNVIGEIRRKKSPGGGDAPEGYEVLMASDGYVGNDTKAYANHVRAFSALEI